MSVHTDKMNEISTIQKVGQVKRTVIWTCVIHGQHHNFKTTKNAGAGNYVDTRKTRLGGETKWERHKVQKSWTQI